MKKMLNEQEQYEKETGRLVAYKAHLYKSVGNGKITTSTMQCGRSLWRNERSTLGVKTNEFRLRYSENPLSVCSNCLAWAKENGKII